MVVVLLDLDVAERQRHREPAEVAAALKERNAQTFSCEPVSGSEAGEATANDGNARADLIPGTLGRDGSGHRHDQSHCNRGSGSVEPGSIPMAGQILVWWALLVVLGRTLAPALERVFPRFPDRGYAFAKPLALISFSYLSWLLTSFGVAPSGSLALGLALLAALWATTRRARELSARTQLVDEGLFAAALFFFAGLRSLQPEIFGAEKYMDFAFFNSLLRADHFPPEDPWLSGAPINYYYFGYLLFANLARLTGVAPAVAYNLAIATIGAILFTGAVSIGRSLTGRTSLGLLGGLATVLLGNLDGFRQLALEHKSLSGFDYWRSSRVVPNTINEFPFFSLLHGDLHPHVTALVIDVSLIALGVAVWQEPLSDSAARPRTPSARTIRLGLLALLLGVLALTNPWDLPIDLVFLGLVFTIRQWKSTRPLRGFVTSALVLMALTVSAVVLAYPFLVHFHAPFHGIGRVHDRTALADFFTVFGVLLLPALGFVGRSVTAELPQEPNLRDLTVAGGVFLIVVLYVATRNGVLLLTAALLVAAMVALLDEPMESGLDPALCFLVVAALALFACEVIYLRDAYGTDLHRMNTVFKFYFQAWIFLALAFPALVRRVGASYATQPLAQLTALLLLAVGIGGALCYPAAVIVLRSRGPEAGRSLDGLRALDRDHPDDAAAIRWMQTHVTDRPVVLEVSGDPYSYFARVSSNTGLPTVLGWANHEGVWRGADPQIASRRRDVDALYKTTDLELARKLLARYRVRFVFVGELERRQFPPEGLAKFESQPEQFPLAFRSENTAVFAVR